MISFKFGNKTIQFFNFNYDHDLNFDFYTDSNNLFYNNQLSFFKENNNKNIGKSFLLSLNEDEKEMLCNSILNNNFDEEIFKKWNTFTNYNLKKILTYFDIENINMITLENLFLFSDIRINNDIIRLNPLKVFKSLNNKYSLIKHHNVIFCNNNKIFDLLINRKHTRDYQNLVTFKSIFPPCILPEIKIENNNIYYIMYSIKKYNNIIITDIKY